MDLKDLLGTIQTGKIIDQNDTHFFVSIDGKTFQLDKKEHLVENTKIKGFLYENSDHKLTITTNIPKIGVDRYAYGEVVDTRTDLGVFVNIGLPDKDIVVSLDDLPEMKNLWPKKNDRLMISIKIDHKDRMWGQLADSSIYQQISRRARKDMKNKDITGTIYRLKMNGSFLLTNDYYLGFIHPSERDREPRLGEVVKGRVIGTSFDNLNLSLKPRAYEEIGDDAEMILAVLKHTEDGVMPYHDKSDAGEIKQYFGISKSSFKRALGHLMKSGLIVQENGSTRLTDEGKKH